jgi:uncharacterized membrane protein YhaH (DUF805 family)
VSSPYNPYPQGNDQGAPGQGYTPFPQGSSGWEQSAPRGYLQGGPVGFGEAISQAFKNLTNFEGRASRSAYWWFFLFMFIIGIVVGALSVAAGGRAIQYGFDGIAVLLGLSLQIRRLHDIDRSGWWWFIGLIPFVGAIVLLVFDCMPGTPGPNKFDTTR